MKNRHILRFLLVRALTTIFHVGGLGVVDKQSDICWVEILPYVSFCIDPKRTSTDENQEHLNCNNQF